LDSTSPLVFVDPAAPATALARVLVDTGGALATSPSAQLAILDLAFDITVDRGPTEGWIEVHVDAAGIHLVSVPEGTEIELGASPSDADWRTALDRLSDGGPTWSVDVLAGHGPTAQALIDLVVRLDGLGVGDLAVGEA